MEHADGRVTPPPFPVLLWLWNSVKVATITAIGIVTLSTTCAYAFARMKFPGKASLLKGMLIFQMFPAVLSLVALYALFDRGPVCAVYRPEHPRRRDIRLSWRYRPACVDHQRLFRNHRRLAGRSGGAGWRDTMAGVPSGSAATVGAYPAVVFILSFIAAITEVPVASLLLRDVNSYTAVGMQQYLNPQNYLWGDFAAAAVLSAIPITVVFLLAQRWLVNGLTAGGVKG